MISSFDQDEERLASKSWSGGMDSQPHKGMTDE